MKRNRIVTLIASALIVSSLAACAPADSNTTAAGVTGDTTAADTTAAGEQLSGKIETDGSSTVYPLSEAIIEAYAEVQPGLTVTASPSGSSAGIERLVNGEIDIAAASRKIKDSEIEEAKGKGIDIVELQVGIDGIAVVANTNNPVSEMTFDDLRLIFGKDAAIKTWKEANPAFPDLPLALFAPGTSSGTFEYFTEVALETKNEQRAADVQVSEDDNVLVTGVSGSEGGLGYFGYTYYEENMDKLKAMKINGVEATQATILDGTYPLARPIFLYVSKKAVAEKPEVADFLNFYLDNAIEQAKEIKMVPATQEAIDASKAALTE